MKDLKNPIIGISGKIGSGKDLIGHIIQKITAENNNPNWKSTCLEKDVHLYSPYNVMKFADSLKDITCLLLGCTREQLEDREFKEKELGEEWWCYKGEQTNKLFPYIGASEATKKLELVKLTPRLLLQLLGTEAGRNILHPNIWVNALMSKYKQKVIQTVKTYEEEPIAEKAYGVKLGEFPSWIITDMRFPNELKAVKDRGGITIRVNRELEPVKGGEYTIKNSLEDTRELVNVVAHIDIRGYDNLVFIDSEGIVYRQGDWKIVRVTEHESETALDSAELDYVIDNNGTVEELEATVKEILIKENVI